MVDDSFGKKVLFRFENIIGPKYIPAIKRVGSLWQSEIYPRGMYFVKRNMGGFMWKLKFEQTYKKIRWGFFLLVILTILLSVGLFITSFTLVNQMRSLHELIPTMNLTQELNTQIIFLDLKVFQYLSGAKGKSIENIIIQMETIKQLAEEQSEKAKDGAVRDNMVKAAIRIESFVKESKSMTPEEFSVKIRDVSTEIERYINKSQNNSEIELTLIRTTSVANGLIIVSFFVALVIGGGLFLGMLIYAYLSKRQMERVDELMNLSMVDELTKLYNKHYLEERMLESINRVQRFSKPLAIVFMKVEFPQTLEDDAYPEVIKEVAARLTKNTRVYDVNSRFSEDTFASIVHEVEEKQVEIVIRRLKNAIEQKEISGRIGESDHKGFFSTLFRIKKRAGKTFRVYVRIVIGSVLYKEGKTSIAEIISHAEKLLVGAEVTKEQFKIFTIKGVKKDGRKGK